MPTRERKEYHAARLVKYVNEYKKVRYCLGSLFCGNVLTPRPRAVLRRRLRQCRVKADG